MSQLALVASPRPPSLVHRGIDLRCCDVVEMLESLDAPADLVVADPPWDYVQHHGATRADNHYRCLRTAAIADHVDRAVGYRLALWTTAPLLGEWMSQRLEGWGRPVTAGTWTKSGEDDSGHYGQGYHWAGCAELVLIYTRVGAYTDREQPLRSAWVEPPQQHSRKPAQWQAQWVRKWVPPGGLVVDLYAGLGSVAEAVLLAGEGRRYVGAEIDPKRHAGALALLAQVRV